MFCVKKEGSQKVGQSSNTVADCGVKIRSRRQICCQASQANAASSFKVSSSNAGSMDMRLKCKNRPLNAMPAP